jgi:rRNA processing protein Gar1
MVLVVPHDPKQIYDLDNIITLKEKVVIGFINDLVGPVTQPLYSISLYPAYASQYQPL